jgi:hypothetical protein
MSTTEAIKTALLGAPLERLERAESKWRAERSRALAAVAAAEQARADAMADDDESFNAARLAALSQKVSGAREVLAGVEMALAEISGRKLRLEADEKNKARELRKQEINAREAAHLAKVKKLHASLVAFAADYRDVLESNEQRFNSLVTVPDPDAAMFYTPVIETAVRLELVKHRIPWAFSWPWGDQQLPDFMAKFDGVPAMVKGWTESGEVA